MTPRILVVDDDIVNQMITEKTLANRGYEIRCVSTGMECLASRRAFDPHLILLDISMPGMDGYEVCRRLREETLGQTLQVVMVSSFATTQERVKAYEMGADDYLIKPFNQDELRSKVKVHVGLCMANEKLAAANERVLRYNDELEDLVAERTQQVVRGRDDMVRALAKLADSRDTDTGGHLERISAYTMALTLELIGSGVLSDYADPRLVENIRLASILHDIGKVGIPDSILLKSGRLTFEEYEIMKTHVIIGAEALGVLDHSEHGDAFTLTALAIIRHHHERYDGTGYPDGLCGEAIPMPARIVAVADVYDALTSVRVYKNAFSAEETRAMIIADSGKHFDPVVVKAFESVFDRFQEIRQMHACEGIEESPLASMNY